MHHRRHRWTSPRNLGPAVGLLRLVCRRGHSRDHHPGRDDRDLVARRRGVPDHRTDQRPHRGHQQANQADQALRLRVSQPCQLPTPSTVALHPALTPDASEEPANARLKSKSHFGHRHRRSEGQHQRLEQHREPRTRPRPGHADLPHPCWDSAPAAAWHAATPGAGRSPDAATSCPRCRAPGRYREHSPRAGQGNRAPRPNSRYRSNRVCSASNSVPPTLVRPSIRSIGLAREIVSPRRGNDGSSY